MDLVPVTFEKLSSIKCSVALAPHERLATPEFLQISFEGTYQSGSSGKGDSRFLSAMIIAAQTAWDVQSTIVDLSNLVYDWGDEMHSLWDVCWSPHYRCNAPLAVIVGDNCRTALKSLAPDEYERFAVESFEEALTSIREQKPKYDRCVKDFFLGKNR